MNGAVRVEGLDRFRAELAAADPKMVREITRAHKKIAETVAQRVRARMAGLGVPKAGEAAEGITASAGQRSAAVVMQASNPFVRAVEFGTKVHWVYGRPVLADTMARRVFNRWARGTDAGYALNPELREFVESEAMETVYGEAIMDAYARAFPERF